MRKILVVLDDRDFQVRTAANVRDKMALKNTNIAMKKRMAATTAKQFT